MLEAISICCSILGYQKNWKANVSSLVGQMQTRIKAAFNGFLFCGLKIGSSGWGLII